MKKLKWALGIVVALLVVVFFVVAFQLGAIVKRGVETMGPRFTGAPVTLESAFLRPLTGKVYLNGLLVSNPEGYQTPSAIELAELKVDIDMASLGTDTIVIKRILIDGPEFTYEKSIKKSNLAAILDNVNAQVPAEETEDAADEPDPDKPGKKVVIESLIVQNAKIRLSTALMGGRALNLPLPPIQMTDIGKEKAVTTPEAVALVLQKIFTSIFDVVASSAKLIGEGAMVVGEQALKGVGAAGDAAGAAASAASDAAGEAVGLAGDAAGAATDAAGAAAKKVGGAAKNIVGGLGGMLKRDSKTNAPAASDQD